MRYALWTTRRNDGRLQIGNPGRRVASLIDIDPDELENCECDFPAKFYVHPKDYKPGVRKARQAWFRLPGKYRNKDAA